MNTKANNLLADLLDAGCTVRAEGGRLLIGGATPLAAATALRSDKQLRNEVAALAAIPPLDRDDAEEQPWFECAACGSASYWLTVTGRQRCLACDPPPRTGLRDVADRLRRQAEARRRPVAPFVPKPHDDERD